MNTAVTNYAGTLRARWRWIVWGVLLALVATTAFLVLWPPLYRSEATIFVRTPGDVSRVGDGGSTYAAAHASTYAALAGSTTVAARVITDLGLDLDPETLSSRITAVNPAGTALIYISVRAPSAGEAQRTATVLISEYAGTVRALESVPGSLVPRAELVVVDPPGPAARVSLWNASIPVLLLSAALLGLVLGLVAAVMGSIFGSSARDRRDASPISGPPDADRSPLGVADAIAEGNKLNLKELLAAVRRYWVTFVLVTAVLFALGLTWILLLPAKFVSSTQLMVSIEGSTTASAYQNDDVVAGRINSYIPLLTSGVVGQRVIDRLGLPLTASEVAAKINATRVPPKTAIIDLEVTDESPARAQLIAQTVAREFVSYTEALETPTGEDSQKVHTTIVTAATAPSEQLAGRVVLGGLAALAALVLGAAAVWIQSARDPVLRMAKQDAVAAGVAPTEPIASAPQRIVEATDQLPRTADGDAAARVPPTEPIASAPPRTLDALEGYRRLRRRMRSLTDRDAVPPAEPVAAERQIVGGALRTRAISVLYVTSAVAAGTVAISKFDRLAQALRIPEFVAIAALGLLALLPTLYLFLLRFHRLLGPLAGLGMVLTVAVIQPAVVAANTRNTVGGSDQAECILVGTKLLLNGMWPYDESQMSKENPMSCGPGWLFAHMPAVFTGYSIASLVLLAGSLLTVGYVYGRVAVWKILLLLALTPVTWLSLINGSDILTFGLCTAALMAATASKNRVLRRFAIPASVLIAHFRLPFLCLPAAVFLRRNEAKRFSGIPVAAATTAASVALWSLFYIIDPARFGDSGPNHVIRKFGWMFDIHLSQFVPFIVLIVASIALAIFCSRFEMTTGVIVFYTAILIPVALVNVYQMTHRPNTQWEGAFWLESLICLTAFALATSPTHRAAESPLRAPQRASDGQKGGRAIGVTHTEG
jgi:capsular polysaccharide biosynthesis protein